MKQYISKSDLVAEIERRIKENEEHWKSPYGIETATGRGILMGYRDILSFLNTLEVKEMDMEESARNYLLNKHKSPLNEVFHQLDLRVEMQYHKDIEHAFKAGFELGLISKGE